MLNEASLIGRVGQSPELRQSHAGKPIATLSLATSESWKNSAGEKQERTEWHRVVCFNEQTANFIDKYVGKGDLVFIRGQIQTRKWTDKDGVDKYSTEIVLRSWAHRLDKLGSPGQNRPPGVDSPDDYGSSKPADPAAGRPQAGDGYGGGTTAADDDIPF